MDMESYSASGPKNVLRPSSSPSSVISRANERSAKDLRKHWFSREDFYRVFVPLRDVEAKLAFRPSLFLFFCNITLESFLCSLRISYHQYKQQTMEPHPMEDSDSWELELRRQGIASDAEHRALKHHKKHHHKHEKADDDAVDLELLQMERDQEKAFLRDEYKKKEKKMEKAAKKHKKLLREMYADPGIRHSTVHGMMIDAGSTGSRLHLFEWEPRVLTNHHEVQEAVSGRKLSFPESASRWTDRLRPGIATFATLPDEQLMDAVADYLSPLLDFATTVLHEKEENFDSFPIFFRATAGMRTLDKKERSRLLGAVRSLFSNKTYCPFYFEEEYARILSGEEEAIFGWAGINFAMGNLVEESEGAGTVINPKLTYGALDMGGASTQISFYEPDQDIMSNLFKLQIGQGKHWNLYAHSFLYFGLNEARNRFQAKLLAGADANERLVQGVYNPCLPGGGRQETRLNIYIDAMGEETWESDSSVSEDGYYRAILVNHNSTADFEKCMEHAKATLNLENNSWCNFAHKGECAFNGVAMSELPVQSEHFGEFLAFSNYYHVWQLLGLPERASLQELYDRTQRVCEMTMPELVEFNKKTGQAEANEIDDICFRSAYAFNMLRHGYRFGMNEYITATNVVNGQKIGWALGAMLYEINTFPWEYVSARQETYDDDASGIAIDGPPPHNFAKAFFFVALAGIAASIFITFFLKNRRNRQYYQPLKEAQVLNVQL